MTQQLQSNIKKKMSNKTTKSSKALNAPSKKKTLDATKEVIERDERDPYCSADFQPTRTITSEMSAMKEVFLRMSEKKVSQKLEKKKECKKLYSKAFETDVRKSFARANQQRYGIVNTLADKANALQNELHLSAQRLQNTHAAYGCKFSSEVERARIGLQSLNQFIGDLDAKYSNSKVTVEQTFDNMDSALELTLQRLNTKLEETSRDHTFLIAFRSKVQHFA